MAVYEIAYGTSRKDLRPKNVSQEWGELVARLKRVEYSEHTLEQYRNMTKTQRTIAKDCGYFMGGRVESGRKTTYRQILSLDIDEANGETLNQLRTWLEGKTYILHSTHSSTAEAPRYRVAVPLHRIVQADEYGAIMRILCDKFKIPIDVATLDFNRLMFLPSVPKDAEYFFENKDGEPLDVEEILNELADWKNMSGLKAPTKVQVQDPRKKGGCIGAFCMRYPIREAIETFLNEKWKPESDGSFSLIGATTSHGGKIYDDNLHLVSFHGSDPYLGRSHNAYDAVRLYKFGDGKAGEAGMLALCEENGIKPETGKRHNVTVEGMEDEEAKRILKERLVIDKNGSLTKSLLNARTILEYDPELRGVFGYDLFSEMPVIKRMPSWRVDDPARTANEHCTNVQTYEGMEDYDESYTREYFEERYDFDARASLTDALNIITHKNAFHPIRDYLNGLEWDGEKRLERIFIDCFGVPDSIYVREVGKKFFVGAVRRVFIPASKMDYVPVLVSEEGTLRKSTFILRMAKLWGSDTFYTFNGGKDAYEQLRGVWLLEIPELDGVQRRSSNARKAFITKGSDRYRAAYLKYTKTYKRQCVFIASSNDVVFLDDPSEDGRRWWGLMCNPDAVTIDIMSDEFRDVLVDQYWAEAVTYYLEGVLPFLSPAADAEARALRQVHKAENLEEGALIDYLNMPIPPDWGTRSLGERRHYWENEKPIWNGALRDVVCTVEVAREFFGTDRGDFNSAHARKIGDAIRTTGLFIQDGSRQRFGEYGIANAWVRKKTVLQIVRESKKKDKE